MSCNESTLGNSPISSGLNPNFIGSSVDRTLNNCPTICSNITPSLCNTSTMSSNNPVGNVTTNLSTSNIVLGGIYSTDSSLQVPSSESPLIIGNLGISNIEGIPANVLLSLLHQQTQALQRKIYIKLENSIFVGAAFNLSPSDTEGIGLSEDTDDSNTKSSDGESLRTTTGGAHTMISFTVGFLMDSSAPPSVLSYLTELSRLIGSQIRRAELMFNYLRDQRDIITSTLEKYSYVDANSWPSSSTTDHNMNKYGSDNINTNRLNQSFPSKRHVKLSEVINTERENSLSSQLTDHDYNENVNQSTNENIPVNKTNDMHDYNNDTRNETTTMNPLERLVQISSLCAELKSILDSICKTGHVNVKINKIYPVCFCLPHKAYCLNNSDKISKFMIAVRPMAVWRAMDKIRPYHALILLLRKDVLLKDFLPTDINPTLNDFINELSPTVSLCNIAERIHSQTHCLNLALWLIYRGHALIVYPIVANNMYVLAPHSKAWFTPQLIGQFATSFPEVNLAELLTSFSTTFMLKDHFHPSIGIADNLHYDADSENNANCFRNKPSKTSWTNLPLTQKINLIAWLLRRRLIIQIHIYIFPTFLSSVNQMNRCLMSETFQII
nr:unnamed protein product [Trichobilharzia regenti]